MDVKAGYKLVMTRVVLAMCNKHAPAFARA